MSLPLPLSIDEITSGLAAQGSVPTADGSGGIDWKLRTVNAQTGTAYTLAPSDGAGNVVVDCSNAGPITLTVPTNASVPFPIGAVIHVRQGGAGKLTIAAAGGVTIHSRSNYLALSAQYGFATLEKTGTNVWALYGDLGA